MNHSESLESVENHSESLESIENHLESLESIENHWNHLESCGIARNLGIKWNFGLILNHVDEILIVESPGFRVHQITICSFVHF